MTDTQQLATLDPLNPDRALASSEEWAEQGKRWYGLIQSGALPKHISNPSIAIAICRYGKAYGWDEMRSLNAIYIVNGKPSLSAQAMRGLVMERMPGASIEQVTCTNEGCVVRARRAPGDDWIHFSFTMEDAKEARCLERGPWKTFRADMFYARASTRACRRMFADVVEGAYGLEEMRDAGQVSQVHKRKLALPDEPDTAEPEALPESEVIDVDSEPAEPPPETPPAACAACADDGRTQCAEGCPGAR